MRLIDADKLFEWTRKSMKHKYPIGDAEQYHTIMFYEVYDEIEDAETVEAIPVDWLLEFETIQNENRNPLFREIDAIREAVYEWRKEHEID